MKFKVTTEITALDLILEMHKGISKQKAKKLIKNSSFLCNGKEVKTIPSTVFSIDQEVEIIKSLMSTKQPRHPDKKNNVVIKFEDEHLIIAIKPVGMLSCKSATQQGVSFDKVLSEFVAKRDSRKKRLWIAHRLDREVEGLIIFAKSEAVQQKLKDNWQSLTKKYLALTENKPEAESGFIESWLRDGVRHKMDVFKSEVRDSKFAKTEYNFLEQKGKYSLLEIKLHTGRKNQIRAHLGSINCPIVGDYTYGADQSVIRQIRLVAFYLEMNHPITKKLIKMTYMPKENFYTPSKNKDEKYK